MTNKRFWLLTISVNTIRQATILTSAQQNNKASAPHYTRSINYIHNITFTDIVNVDGNCSVDM